MRQWPHKTELCKKPGFRVHELKTSSCGECDAVSSWEMQKVSRSVGYDMVFT